MSEETFAVTLGGKRWDLPHLPFRAIKAIQPALFDIYLAADGPAISNDSIARLGEAELDRLAEATWRAIAHIDPATLLFGLPRSALLGRRTHPGLSLGRDSGRTTPQTKRDAGGVA